MTGGVAGESEMAKMIVCRKSGVRKIWAAWAMVCALCLLATVSTVVRGQQSAKPNIILIGVDTLRSDRLGCYGYKEISTPNVDSLAADSTLFENTVSQVPLTLPSFCSIMTGTYPMYHGVRDFSYGYLADNQTTLAEILKSQGYSTAAFIAAFVLDKRFGLNQGFDYYDGDFDLALVGGEDPGTIAIRGDKVMDRALTWMGQEQKKPFFAWIHLYDPHHPFEPPEPFRSQYTGRLYDGEVAYTDSLIGKLLDWLKQKGLYEDSLIIFMSDHGESLGEHQEENHGYYVYDASVKVPLIIKAPGNQPSGKRIASQVRTVDVLPTVLQYVRLRKPATVQGLGLRSLIEGKEGKLSEPYAYSESYYAHSSFGWSPIRSLRTDNQKFILTSNPEFYDLVSDPHELKNAVRENQALSNRLKEDLQRMESMYTAREEGLEAKGLDPETTEKLRSLGYVALSEGRRSVADEDFDKLSDPKEKIGIFNLYLRAQDFSQAGKVNEAVGLLEELIAQDPSVNIVIHTLSNRYIQNGWFQKAVEMNLGVLKRVPDSEAAIFNLGRAYSKLKQADEAIAAYKKALELNPDRQATYHNLGVAYLEKQDYQQSIPLLKRAIELQPNLVDPYVNLGLAYFLTQNSALAIETLEKAVRLGPDNARAHNYLGNVYLRTGRRAEGEAELKRAKDLQARP